jgi:hypothetical protein
VVSERDGIAALQRSLGNRAVQRLFGPDSRSQQSDDLGQQIRSTDSGSPMEANVQLALEQQLGADLSGVRVHADAHADNLAREVDAVAFTSGSDIFFRAGAYSPSTEAGRHTLAHEAVHVVQQAAGPVTGSPVAGGVALSSPHDEFERAADATASAMQLE